MRRLLFTALFTLIQAGSSFGFETNGHLWPQMPIHYWINPSGCPILPSGKTFEELVAEAAAQWSSQPCATVSFELSGTTTAGLEPDGQSTFLCIAQDWNCGAGAAGCNIWIPRAAGETPENDIALNADTLEWVEGGPDATQTGSIDPVAVLTHEIGHMLGLAHSADPYASMYYGTLPNAIQATLDGDDRAGICSLYPSGAPGCATDADCGDDQACVDIQGQMVCDDMHDGPGALCSKTHIDCADMCWVSFFECSQVCLFTAADYTQGYCAPLCNDKQCPPDFHCVYLSQYDVNVCFVDEGSEDGGDGGEPDGAFEESPVSTDDDGQVDEGSDAANGDPDSGTDLDVPAGGGCGCGGTHTFGWLPICGLPFLLRSRRRLPTVQGKNFSG
ncbi:MAG TPA: matrixin family metalloprotease [Myxococcota bacterium]|nr:matrixin family metalloprotease [Myxococcota bacterium]